MALPPMLAKLLGALLIEHLWPWFLAKVWPLLLDHLGRRAGAAFERLRRRQAETVDHTMDGRASAAAARAAEAEQRADTAADAGARERLLAEARIWREVAEQFRSENEALKAELARLQARTADELAQDLNAQAPELRREGRKTTLVFGDTRRELPGLPTPDEGPRRPG